MTPTATKIRSPLKMHGGKQYLARRIVELMPEHTTYVEPFCGGLSVLLNKPESTREVAADLDSDLVAFWRSIRNVQTFARVRGILDETAYVEWNFEQARGTIGDTDDHALHAACYLIRNRMSRGGMGKTFAWSERLRGGQPGDLNAWQTAMAGLPDVHGRIRSVVFWNCHAAETIAAWDGPDTLFYLDPPYVPSTRTARQVYGQEMSEGQHVGLLDQIRQVRGRVMISGYRCELYDRALAAWNRVDWDMPNHAGQGKSKQRRTESLWMSF